MSKIRKFLRKYSKQSIAALLLLIAFVVIYFASILKSLPDPNEFNSRKIAQSTKIYDRTGQVLLYEIHGEEKRTVIPFSEIPDIVKQATIAIEDSGFYNHAAFDWKSMVRAIIANILKGQIVQGGSTITQQLAKNAFLSPEKTITRKIKELFVSFELEKRYTKDEILNLYLNQIPYGGNAYGIEAASKVFFNKSAKDLTLAQAALLASLPKSTTYYSPWGSHLDELLARKNNVLEKMFALGYIAEKEKNQAQKEKLEFAPRASGIKAPHFVLTIQEYLNNKYGEAFVESAGLNVITTLDWDLQQMAEKAVADGAERNKNLYKGYNAALMAQDAATGQILAMVGSKNYFGKPEPENCTPGKDCRFEGNFNVVTQGLRQPGSALKPLSYVTAFEKGYSPDTAIFDLPTEFTANNPDCPLMFNFSDKENKDCFHPNNFDKTFRGPINFRNALAQSVNVPAVKVLYLAGIDNVLKTAADFGITTLKERSRYGLSLVLGGGEVKLQELVGAYSVFAQEGIKHQQAMILKITSPQNQILEEYKDSAEQVIEAQYTRLINDILSDAKARAGLLTSSLNLTVFPGHEVALKTGTSNDYHDAWAIGYTPDFIVGVWAGNNNNMAMEKNSGSILAAIPMWSAFMKDALKNKPLTTFNQPDPVFNKKAMLRGEYIVNYKIGETTYPQIHDILYYVDKNDPRGPQPTNPENDSQFNNWEQPVLKWAKENISNFETAYNQLSPAAATNESDQGEYQPKIQIASPANGAFIKQGEGIKVSAKIESMFDISKIEIYWNETVINSLIVNPAKIYELNYVFAPTAIELQNSLKIKTFDVFNNSRESSLILFK